MSSVPDAGAKVDVIRIDGLQKKKNRMTEKENPLKKKKSIFVIKNAMPLLTLSEIEEAVPVFRGRFGNGIARTLMKFLAVDRINGLYDRNCHFSGPAFAGAILDDIGVRYTVFRKEVLEHLPEGPFITISNHPYGSIDGIILADLFGHIRDDYKMIVNRMLSIISALGPCFISVTPAGNGHSLPTKDSIAGIKEAIRHVRGGHPLGIFPAGAVSDLSLKDRCIRDREWQMPIAQLVRKLNVPVIPVRFIDRNSDFYYSLGLIDWRVRLLRLPSEVFNKRGKPVRLVCGDIISPEMQSEIRDDDTFRQFLRERVYNLKIN